MYPEEQVDVVPCQVPDMVDVEDVEKIAKALRRVPFLQSQLHVQEGFVVLGDFVS